MNPPVDPNNVAELERIYTNAWRSEESVRPERARAGLRAVALALVPPGHRVVPIDPDHSPAPEPGELDRRLDALHEELMERRERRGW